MKNYDAITLSQRGTWKAASSSTFCCHLGPLIRELFHLLHAVRNVTEAL